VRSPFTRNGKAERGRERQRGRAERWGGGCSMKDVIASKRAVRRMIGGINTTQRDCSPNDERGGTKSDTAPESGVVAGARERGGRRVGRGSSREPGRTQTQTVKQTDRQTDRQTGEWARDE